MMPSSKINLSFVILATLIFVGLVVMLPSSVQAVVTTGTYTGGGGGIPDLSSTFFTLSIGDDGPIQDLNVTVNLSHPHSGDLKIFLRHVDTGTRVQLLEKVGLPFFPTFGCSSDGLNVIFDDSAAQTLDSFDCTGNFDGIVGGSWQPTAPLSAFNGQGLIGTWELEIQDVTITDVGSLAGWGLTIVYDSTAVVPPPPPPPGGGTVTVVQPGFEVPHVGLIMINQAQAQPLFQEACGGVVRDSSANEIWLPADFDKNWFDTYVVTEVRLCQEQVWFGIFMGGRIWGWVPMDNVTILEYIPIPDASTTEGEDANTGNPSKNS
jgi:hypothetical protein